MKIAWFHISCSAIQIEGHKDVAVSLVAVFIINELSAYGEMSIMAALAISTVSSIAWRQQVSWILKTIWT